MNNLLDLAMRIVDFKCDVYVLYLGVNDLLTAAPLDIYRRDYAHFRQTLHENLSYVSFYPSWLLHLKSFRVILQASGVPDSKDLISNTATGQFRRGFQIAIEERASVNQAIRQTVIRNVTSMVGIIRAHQPEALIILSSFVDLANKQVIQDLNRDFSKLAKTHNLVFVDAANKVPRDTKIAYDYGHFTPAGDRLMGRLFAETIAECIMTTQ